MKYKNYSLKYANGKKGFDFMKKLYSMFFTVIMIMLASALPAYAGGAFDIVEVGGSYNLHLYADEPQTF